MNALFAVWRDIVCRAGLMHIISSLNVFYVEFNLLTLDGRTNTCEFCLVPEPIPQYSHEKKIRNVCTCSAFKGLLKGMFGSCLHHATCFMHVPCSRGNSIKHRNSPLKIKNRIHKKYIFITYILIKKNFLTIVG